MPACLSHNHLSRLVLLAMLTGCTKTPLAQSARAGNVAVSPTAPSLEPAKPSAPSAPTPLPPDATPLGGVTFVDQSGTEQGGDFVPAHEPPSIVANRTARLPSETTLRTSPRILRTLASSTSRTLSSWAAITRPVLAATSWASRSSVGTRILRARTVSRVVSLQTPGSPSFLDQYQTRGAALRVKAINGIVYGSEGLNGLEAIDGLPFF